MPRKIFEHRYSDIRRFERYLSRNGVVVLKLVRHVSKKEQKKRLLERPNDPRKYWKLSGDDVKEHLARSPTLSVRLRA